MDNVVAGTRAKVVDLQARRAARQKATSDSERDRQRNAAWDRFLALSEADWCWRDPGSFTAVELCLQTLRLLTLPTGPGRPARARPAATRCVRARSDRHDEGRFSAMHRLAAGEVLA